MTIRELLDLEFLQNRECDKKCKLFNKNFYNHDIFLKNDEKLVIPIGRIMHNKQLKIFTISINIITKDVKTWKDKPKFNLNKVSQYVSDIDLIEFEKVEKLIKENIDIVINYGVIAKTIMNKFML